MDLVRHLSFFVAVAEEGHFGDAAARLEMTQPPVSQGLRRLEKELGVTLIRRTSRGADLTSAGRELLPRARLLVDDAKRLSAEARRLADRADVLRWGAVLHLGAPLTAVCAQQVASATTDQDMVTEPASALVAQVIAGSLDVAVIDHPCVTGTLVADSVVRLPRWLVLPADHAAAGAARPRLRALTDLAVCLPPRAWNPPAHDQIVDGFREHGLDSAVRPVTSDTELVAAVAGGSAFGLTAHPELFAAVPSVRCASVSTDVTALRLRVIHKSPDHAAIAADVTAALRSEADGGGHPK
ncbi:LysR family transcriptional regulator [Gordonia sp. SL306]|uniref:LysR family transcriptional regulator n=1 Tax=Gordonia sp. SL306 TaxID=2995145 RepID=UPI00227058EC|nr:LysR family transcriptional regulator [Gordonia sp. SL306]WAC57603.1 LysR family transcriptional regulator [Gordonia sp. SL306]